jgi:putative membrane-bound dehydrogenase-like protein
MTIRVPIFAFAVLMAAQLAFGAGRQLTGQHAPATTPALSPEEAQKKFTVPDGFEIRNFAAEPDVINPVAMTWDDRGRLWVVELFEYPLGAPEGTKPRDRIKILEDTNNDGKADKVTVFADGLNLATGIALGRGGAFVGQAPHLLFLKDTNGDDVADTREVVMTGFGMEDRHELLNGFTWGPDGSLYMTHGVFTFSKVKDPNRPDDDGVLMTAAVARFQPSNKRFEIFAEGTSNPWGVDFDANGNAFVSACVIEHLFHMAPGGIYVRQAGSPPNPYAYQLLPSINDHKHFRAAYAGVQVYQGNQYPAEYQGTIFMGNIHDSAVHQDKLNPNGSSFRASFIKDFVRANDGWFRPVSSQVGPDGALWIMDWYDKYPCYQNANADPEGVDRERGRIWRVVYTGRDKGAPVPSHPANMNLGKASTAELVKTLEHPNIWQRRMAQRLLAERKDLSARAALVNLLDKGSNHETRMAAFWSLFGIGAMDDEILDKAVEDKDAGIRIWAARFTAEKQAGSEADLARLARLAGDSDPSVKVAVATAARQFASGSLTVDTPPRTAAQPNLGRILSRLIQGGDGSDPLLPFMIWMAGEPGFARDPEPVLQWFAQNGMRNPAMSGLLVKKAMRRLCDTENAGNIGYAIDFLDNASPDAAPILIQALDGLIEGEKGRGRAAAPNASAVLAKLGKSENKEVAARAQQLASIWGDSAALQASIKILLDPNQSVDTRVKAAQSIRQQKTAPVRAALLQAALSDAPDPVAQAAIQGLSEVGGDEIGQNLLAGWEKFSPGARRLAAEILTTRRPWAEPFLAAIENKKILAAEIPAPVFRNLAQSRDDFIRKRAEAVIGRFRESNPDKLKLIAEKKKMILEGTPDLQKGHEVAKRTCFTCHKLHGEGAEVGPDLTGVGRSSLDALLANVIDPNQIIGKGYENVQVEMKDGRSLSGRLAEDTDSRIKLISAGPKEEVVSKKDIESFRVSELSVMPEGLEQMPDEDFRNLIWFILNPPEDKKAILLKKEQNALVAQVRRGGELVDLVAYSTDPKFRPYLHPVKDPTGRITLTDDKPQDHPWQHGIFTGLHQVNGIDFWTEKEGKQHFLRIASIVQEQDHVGWTAIAEWVGPDGKAVLEEEQSITLTLTSDPEDYLIDFAWQLRPAGETVKIGRHDYGGLAVRMPFSPDHSHLNSAGAVGKAAANQRADWCDVTRKFNGVPFGITVIEHPKNPGFPNKWRVDDQGLINPSPSLSGDWTVEKGGSVQFNYRLVVHSGTPKPTRIQELAKEFAGRDLRLSSSPPAQDGESIALWNPEWRITAPDFEGSPRKFPAYRGKNNVLMTHPYSQEKGSAIERDLLVPQNKRTELAFEVASHENGDWLLKVVADGKVLKTELVEPKSGWMPVSVDLTPFAGRQVHLRLENCANNWEWEFGYWRNIQLRMSDPRKTASK